MTSMDFYAQRQVLVTGGLGFIGSNLAHALVDSGASVTVLDAKTPEDGANDANVEAIKDRIKVIQADLGDLTILEQLVGETEVIFNLAGKVSHIDSLHNPLADLYANGVAHLRLLEVCRKVNPGVRIVYTSTRQIYGKTDTPTVTEESPIRPIDPNGISKFSADAYHRMFARDFQMNTVVLRLTNTYGPRQLLAHNRQGFIPWFIRLAMEGKEISVFGDGLQTRDINYVDDVVDALLAFGARSDFQGDVFNLGSPQVHTVKAIAETVIAVAKSGSLKITPFPDEKKNIDIGSIACDYSKIRSAIDWNPKIDLMAGMTRTVDYYRNNWSAYVPS